MSRSTAVRCLCGLSFRHAIGVVRPSAPRQDVDDGARRPPGESPLLDERGAAPIKLEADEGRLRWHTCVRAHEAPAGWATAALRAAAAPAATPALAPRRVGALVGATRALAALGFVRVAVSWLELVFGS